jgi:hypothetical protein
MPFRTQHLPVIVKQWIESVQGLQTATISDGVLCQFIAKNKMCLLQIDTDRRRLARVTVRRPGGATLGTSGTRDAWKEAGRSVHMLDTNSSF